MFINPNLITGVVGVAVSWHRRPGERSSESKGQQTVFSSLVASDQGRRSQLLVACDIFLARVGDDKSPSCSLQAHFFFQLITRQVIRSKERCVVAVIGSMMPGRCAHLFQS